MWCNTEITGKITLPDINETYDNIDTENPICWEIEFNAPMETSYWPEEKLKLPNHEIEKPHHSYGQFFHTIQMAVDEGGKH